jgi:hypothetical protein
MVILKRFSKTETACACPKYLRITGSRTVVTCWKMTHAMPLNKSKNQSMPELMEGAITWGIKVLN